MLFLSTVESFIFWISIVTAFPVLYFIRQTFDLCFRSSFHTSVDTRAHDLLRWAFLWARYGPLSGILEVFVAQAFPEQRDSCYHQHHGLGQRSARIQQTSWNNVRFKRRLKRCCSGHPQGLDFSCWWTWSAFSQFHMWCSWTTVGSPSLPPSRQSFWGWRKVTRLTRPRRQPWMSLQSTTTPPGATPTFLSSQSSRVLHGREHRECSNPCEGVNIRSSKSWFWHGLVTGNTSAATSTESCRCWPTWASSSLQTLDQLDLSTALRLTRYTIVGKSTEHKGILRQRASVCMNVL